ncbi:hypothetical protein ACNJYD_08940 [Bradyrhizobium sp. DASA03005]|uniref:hypothetical protein n=1 Tax=Bradyrhizobium sp. SPXBL-02 TaxID=3395912 RepID=UPI003F7161F8
MKQSPAGETIVAAPGSLLSQYKLLRAVIDAPWATRLDHKITSHIIDRYFGKYGVARASLRYLELATGATRTNIIESLRRITDQGAITVKRQGIGTRPTEYSLNFDFVTKIARGPVEDTAISGPVDDTSAGPVGNTASVPSGPVDSTESCLRNPLTSGLTVSRTENTPAVPTAPPVSGVNADTAETAGDPGGFEELWAVFPRKHQRAKAQAAYRALAPSAALHATLVTRAAAWASHYQQTATEKKWWKHLHTWLVEERYLEDLPEPYENRKEAAIARAKENGPRKARENEAGKSGLSSKTPIGGHSVKIVNSEVVGGAWDQERELVLSLKIEDGDHAGKEFSHAFKLMSADESAQDQGMATYRQIREATGVLEPDDTSDFHGKSLRAIVKSMGRVEYVSL